jgi:hypothetical protein
MLPFRACSACIVAFALCVTSAPATSWDTIPIPPDPEILFPPSPSEPGHPKMDGALWEVADVAASESDEAALLRAACLGVRTDEGRVQVHIVIEPDDATAVVEAVDAAAGVVTKSSTGGSVLQAWLPPGALLAIADETVVLYVRVPNLAVTAAWSERFTFEEGFEGWESYEAYRAEAGLLDGYSVYGYDGTRMWKTLWLTGEDSLVMDVHFTGDDPRRMPNFVVVWARRLNSLGVPYGDRVNIYGQSLFATSENPSPNPDRKRFDLTPFNGSVQVGLQWNQLVCIPEDILPCLDVSFPGFVDNITIPEPSPALLSLASVATCAGLARRRAREFARR